jgi:Mrp family chromosome partitioning ATPase
MPSNPAELLGSSAMRELLARLGTGYDLILIDSSPVLAVTDATVLTTEADAILLVVAAGETRLREFGDAIDLIVNLHGKKPGIVLNKFDFHRAYGIAYGHYSYGYYTYSDDDGQVKKRGRKSNGRNGRPKQIPNG